MKKKSSPSLVERVAYSPSLSRLAFRALNNRLFLRLPPYKSLLRKQIRAVKGRNAAFPLVVAAENTNVCNARCVMCPYVNMKRPKGFMDMALYRKIVDECAEHEGVELRLAGFGEPLLDRDLLGRIEYAKGKGIEKVQLTTNASLLDEEMSRGILESGLDEIMLSIDGYDRESYGKIRVGLDFDVVYGNIRRFREMRGGRAKLRILASIILFENYAAHRERIIRLWRDCADGLLVKPPEDWAGEVSGLKRKVVGGKLHFPCPYIWTQFLITWEGVAALCCRDFCNIRVPIGSVADDSIYDIWHGDTLKRYREIDAEGRTLEPCRECSYNPNWWGEK